MAVPVEFLSSIPYFLGLSPDELEPVRRVVFEKALGRGEMIMLEGDSTRVLYFVVSGVVKVFKTSAEGKEQILSIVRPGESFNDVPVFDGGPNPASAQAMGQVVLCGIKGDDLGFILQEHPRIALNVIQVLSQRLRHLVSLVEDLSFRHVTARVAKILLEHADDGMGSKPRLTQREMAAMASTAREVIGRSLKALEGEGAIRLERHRIVIADKQMLRGMAGIAV